MKILVIIAARGGSKGIPRKNVRLIAGFPLISYSIKMVLESKYNLDLVVSTDDDEIARVSEKFGAKVILRPTDLATDATTLDPVIFHALKLVEYQLGLIYDVVINVQPTSPLMKSKTLDEAIDLFLEDNYDTLISGINKPHLSWIEDNETFVPAYKERLNRQFLPKNIVETGSFVITKRDYVKRTSRFGKHVSIYELTEREALDIDTYHDWWVVEKEFLKKNILIRVDGYSKIGLGHIYRTLLIAYKLTDHNIKFILSEKSDLGLEIIENSHFDYEIITDDLQIPTIISDFSCDIFLNDILDTSSQYIKLLKSKDIRVVNFEDLGDGANFADAVINDLYEKRSNQANHYWGSDYFCLRDEFLLAEPAEFHENVKEILVVFGGTDPSNLTKKVFDVIKEINLTSVHYTFIFGLGYENYSEIIEESQNCGLNADFFRNVKLITDFMSKADIAFSSQGRTMLELASMQVPTILMAQNSRELKHEFGYLQNGFINLGQGIDVNHQTIKQTLLWLVYSPQIRKQMKSRMKKSNLKDGINKVIKIILNQ